MPDQEGKGVWNGVSEGDGEEQVEVFQHLLEHLFAPFLIGLHGVEGEVERPGDFLVAFALEGKLVDAAQGRVQLADGLHIGVVQREVEHVDVLLHTLLADGFRDDDDMAEKSHDLRASRVGKNCLRL